MVTVTAKPVVALALICMALLVSVPQVRGKPIFQRIEYKYYYKVYSMHKEMLSCDSQNV